jgi:hypothetical protein
MRKTPTIEQAERIAHVLSGITVNLKANSFAWGTNDNRAEGLELCKAISGYKPKSACITCYVRVANILAEAIGLPPYDHGTTEERKAFRLDVCATCPAYHASTQSCGRLILDAINPEPVMIDGEAVNPCGCYLPIKTSMKRATCPAGRWT